MPGVEKVGRHRCAHIAEADETDIHDVTHTWSRFPGHYAVAAKK
jgi:hypothetical protein